jgi:hypothetical protein
MSKILIGAVAGALWILCSYAANADRVCKQVCDNGNCVSKCVEHNDTDVIVHDHDGGRDRAPGVQLNTPGGDVHIGR